MSARRSGRRPPGDGLAITRVGHTDHEPPADHELPVDHDLLVILEAYDLEAFGATGLRTYDLAVMTQAGAVYLAQLGDEIVGGCQLLRVLDEPGFFYVVGFYIRPEWRGRGLGRAFLLGVAAEIRRMRAEGMILTVAPDNAAAIGLYKGAGFVDESFIPDFYGKGQHRHIMRWRFDMGAAEERSPGHQDTLTGAIQQPAGGLA
jgi:ribosomal protein S18 acetylase RimI-like enzyme